MSVKTALRLRQGHSKRQLRTAARIRRQRKQRQRILATAAASLFALGAIPLSYATFTGTDLVLPGTQAARSFLALMSDRSPGERTHAELAKGKPAAAPRQRALGKVREPEPPKDFIEAIAPPLPTIEEVPLKTDLAVASPEIPGLFISSPPPGGGIFVPPGGGGPPPGQPEPPEQPEQPEQPEPPVPPVPEPSTWAMMLLGFGLTGVMIRRRRRTATPIAT